MIAHVAPWLFAVAAVLTGWLTPSQIAVTMAFEVVVALPFAKRRIALSRGPITTGCTRSRTTSRSTCRPVPT